MKKLAAVLLSFCVMLSFANADDNSPVLGVWLYNSVTSTTSRKNISYEIAASGRAYYSSVSFSDDGEVESEHGVYTWDFNDNHLSVNSGDSMFKDLYLQNDFTLTSDPNGAYGFYYKVVNSERDLNKEEQEIAVLEERAAAARAKSEINRNPCGKWSFYMDVSNYPKQLKEVWGDTLTGFDLYIYQNGSVYMTEMHQSKDDSKPAFAPKALDGLWIGDEDDMSLRVGDFTYKAKVDDDGNLLLYMTESLPTVFVRVDQSEVMLRMTTGGEP